MLGCGTAGDPEASQTIKENLVSFHARPAQFRSAPFRAIAAVAAAIGLVAAAIAVPTAASAASSPDAPVVISEVYGGGGNSGAAFNRDFIELYNKGTTAVDLTGWAVQYASTAGTSWQVTSLNGKTLDPGKHLLIGEAVGANAGLPAIVADVEGAIPLSGTGGKVALVHASAPLAGCAATCSTLPDVVDFLGWGAATDFAGTGPAPGTANATSVARNAAKDNTANNAVDFTVGAPTPLGQGGIVDPDPDPDPELHEIAEIQGTGAESPLVGLPVITRGVVTATYPTGGYSGYVIQTQGTGGALDASHTASDAIFVYSPTTAATTPLGAFVEVTGAVSEYKNNPTTDRRAVTQITVAAEAGRTILNDPFTAPIASSVAWPTTDEGREALESMLVTPTGSFTVSNTFATNQFGEVGLAAGTTPLRQPTDAALPGSPEAAAVAADNAARAVALDDGATTNFLNPANSGLTPPWVSTTAPVRVGAAATLTAPVIVDWRNNTWKFQPTTPLSAANPSGYPATFENTRTPAPEPVGGDLSVASFNVLNYFTTLGATGATCVANNDRTGDGVTVSTGCDQRGAWDPDDLARQQVKIVTAINALDASVVGLLEIENSAALGEQADEALTTLVGALNAAAGDERWAFVASPANLPDASLQDVITNAIIYQPAIVTPVGASTALGTESAEGQAFANAREPIAQAFHPASGGEDFVVVVNHFKSKSAGDAAGEEADAGDGQGAWNASRVRQATALRDWVASDPTGAGTDSVLLVGDFNSYGQEDPLQVLFAAGYVDAEQSFALGESSYSFSGLSGSLDHVLLSGAAAAWATGADIWTINSPESLALEYSRYNYHGTLFYATDAYRSSDHDPVQVGLSAGVDPSAVATETRLFAVLPVHINRVLPTTLVAWVTLEQDGTTPAGTVEFREGSTVVGTAAVVRGAATFRLPNTLPRGTHRYTATFVPSDTANVKGSTSAEAKVIVLF